MKWKLEKNAFRTTIWLLRRRMTSSIANFDEEFHTTFAFRAIKAFVSGVLV